MAEGKALSREVPIIELGEERADDAATIMAQAFQDNPVLVRACPDRDTRVRLLPWMFRWSTWKGLRFGKLLGTAGRLEGVAALVGPDGGEFTAQDLTHIDHVHARKVIGPELWDGVLAANDEDAAPAEAALHLAAPEPHWYLDALAVIPERQGQGIGSALLRAAARRYGIRGCR